MTCVDTNRYELGPTKIRLTKIQILHHAPAEVCHCQTDSSAAPLVVMATFMLVIGVVGVMTCD